MPEETVLVYATANLRTEIRETSGGYRWLHTSGWESPNELAEPPRAVVLAASRIRRPRVQFVCPTRVNGMLAFDLPAPVSLGWRLLSGKTTPTEAIAALTAVGGALRDLHGNGPNDLEPVPRLADLRDWLASGRGLGDAQFLHTVLAETLGPDRMGALLAWCEELVSPGDSACLVHGGLTLNHIVTDPHTRIAHIPIGLGIGSGRPVVDLAKVVAEVPEYRQIGALVGRPDLDVSTLSDALLAGYGASVDPAELRRAVAVMTALRTHAIAAHIGWRDLIHERISELLGLVDGCLR